MDYIMRYRQYPGSRDIQQNSPLTSVEGLPEQLLAYYDIKPRSFKRRDNYWLIDSDREKYIIVEDSGEIGLLPVALGWQNHLFSSGCRQVLQIKKAKTGKELLELEDRVFHTAVWTQASSSLETGVYEGQKTAHLFAVVTALAKLHGYNNGYLPAVAREISIFWPRIIQERLTELITCKHIFKENKARTDFEKIFLESFDFFYDQGQESLQNMVLAGYGSNPQLQDTMLINSFMAKDIFLDNEEVLFLNLSKWGFGPGVMDISLFLNSYMPLHKWDMKLLRELIEQYIKHKTLAIEERHLLLAQLRFPSRYWLYVYQYCNDQEKAPVLAEKLKSYLQECYWRDLCLDNIEGWLRKE